METCESPLLWKGTSITKIDDKGRLPLATDLACSSTNSAQTALVPFTVPTENLRRHMGFFVPECNIHPAQNSGPPPAGCHRFREIELDSQRRLQLPSAFRTLTKMYPGQKVLIEGCGPALLASPLHANGIIAQEHGRIINIVASLVQPVTLQPGIASGAATVHLESVDPEHLTRTITSALATVLDALQHGETQTINFAITVNRKK